MRPHVDDHVFETFAGAVEQREKDGLELDNRLVAIEQALIAEAALERSVAVVTVRFEADIAAVTRNAEGEVVAGSLSDAVQTRDLLDLPPRHRVARSQLAADRNRRGRVSALCAGARARVARCCLPPARRAPAPPAAAAAGAGAGSAAGAAAAATAAAAAPGQCASRPAWRWPRRAEL